MNGVISLEAERARALARAHGDLDRARRSGDPLAIGHARETLALAEENTGTIEQRIKAITDRARLAQAIARARRAGSDGPR